MKLKTDNRCLNEDMIFEYFIGELHKDSTKIVEAHLRNCNTCLLKIREFALVKSGLETEHGLPVPEDLMQRVIQNWKKNVNVTT